MVRSTNYKETYCIRERGNMTVKELMEMLKIADPNSEVVFDLRDYKNNAVGYFEIHSNWKETGGYDPDELDYYKVKKNAKVELCMKFDDNEQANMLCVTDTYGERDLKEWRELHDKEIAEQNS